MLVCMLSKRQGCTTSVSYRLDPPSIEVSQLSDYSDIMHGICVSHANLIDMYAFSCLIKRTSAKWHREGKIIVEVKIMLLILILINK